MKSWYIPGAATARTAQNTRKTTTSAGIVTTQGFSLRAMKMKVNTTETMAMRTGPE